MSIAAAPGSFAALRVFNFRLYFAGQMVSNTGTWMQQVAQAWLVLQLSHSGTILGVVVAAQTLPMLLFGPYGGLIADRFNKRRVLMLAQGTLGLLALLLGTLAALNVVRIWMVIVLAVLLGFVNATENPTRQAFMLEMVGGDNVRSAVSLSSVMINVARAVGPAVAGIIIALVGVTTCFFINALSYVGVLIAMAAMRTTELQPTQPQERSTGQLREGFRYVRSEQSLILPLVMMALIGTLAYEFAVSLPLFAQKTFHGDASDFGFLTSSMGVGAVLSGLIVAGHGRVGVPAVTRGAAAFGVSMLVAAIAPNLPLAMAAMALVGASSVAFISTGNSTLQLNSDPRFRGRVMALWSVAFIGSTPIGGPIVGFVGEHFSPRWALALGALTCLSAAGLGHFAHRSNTPSPELGVTSAAPTTKTTPSSPATEHGKVSAAAGVVQRQNISFPS